MRLIDADEIVLDYSGLRFISPYDGMAIAKYFADQIKAMPTITPPPNDPLTLEQLRGMDGEPVWVERPGYGKRWALVQVWAKSTNVIYLIQSNGAVLQPQVELDCGGKIYRRKPEEGTT